MNTKFSAGVVAVVVVAVSGVLLSGCGPVDQLGAEAGPTMQDHDVYEIRLPGATWFAGKDRSDVTLKFFRPARPWLSTTLRGPAIHRGNRSMRVDGSNLQINDDGTVSGTFDFRYGWRRIRVTLDDSTAPGPLSGTATVFFNRKKGPMEREIPFEGTSRPARLPEATALLGTGPNWPSWPAELNWARVIDITQQAGSDWDAKIQAAQDQLAETGGVIYFPPGEYELNETVRLRSGVILRGAQPDGSSDPRNAEYSLPTKLIFPRYKPKLTGQGTARDSAFKGIELAEPDTGRDVGVINLDIHHGHVHLGRWKGFPKRFADGTAGGRFLVCGNILRNAATLDPQVPTEWQHPWQRWTDREAAAIHCYARRDVLIAGNRIPGGGEANFTQPGFRVYKDKPATHQKPKTKEVVTIDVPFDYDNRPGIMVNPKPLAKALQIWTDVQKVTSPPTPESGTDIPPAWGLAKGIIIRNNYVFNTGCVAIKTSGDGTFVGWNVIRYQPGVIRPTYTGLTLSNFTNNNRAVEMKGWRWTVQGNDYEVYSNYGPDGTKYNDGEGIMHEAWENVGVRDSRIINNRGNRYICLWRVPVRGLEIRDNHIRTGGGQPAITVLGQTNKGVDLPAERVKIIGNITEGTGIKLLGDAGPAAANEIRDNRHVDYGGADGTVRDETGAAVEGNQGY
ncbi:MAG: hypothetical protein ACLFVU_04575 [Phycisphaerae bacterium]